MTDDNERVTPKQARDDARTLFIDGDDLGEKSIAYCRLGRYITQTEQQAGAVPEGNDND